MEGGGEVPRGSTLPVRLAFQDLYMPRQARMVTFKMVYAPSPASPILPMKHLSAVIDTMPCMIVDDNGNRRSLYEYYTRSKDAGSLQVWQQHLHRAYVPLSDICSLL